MTVVGFLADTGDGDSVALALVACDELPVRWLFVDLRERRAYVNPRHASDREFFASIERWAKPPVRLGIIDGMDKP